MRLDENFRRTRAYEIPREVLEEHCGPRIEDGYPEEELDASRAMPHPIAYPSAEAAPVLIYLQAPGE